MSGLCIHCGARLEGEDDGRRAAAVTATGALCGRCDAAFWEVVRAGADDPRTANAPARRTAALAWVVAALVAAAATCLGLYLLLADVVGSSLSRTP